jgi:hypothetical protein
MIEYRGGHGFHNIKLLTDSGGMAGDMVYMYNYSIIPIPVVVLDL